MFVQVIEGRTTDAGRFTRQFEQWAAELRPGADGFLGSTAGVTEDGRAIVLARFDSEEQARANSDRPEQGAWWDETVQCFDGAVGFTDATEVDVFLAGGSDEAGFVQVMRGSDADPDRLRAMDRRFEEVAHEVRPDLIGGFRVWTGPSSYIEVAYFTSEAEARAAEQKEMPAELAQQFEELQQAMGNVEHLDLRQPIFA
jgi:hypothetical protein